MRFVLGHCVEKFLGINRVFPNTHVPDIDDLYRIFQLVATTFKEVLTGIRSACGIRRSVYACLSLFVSSGGKRVVPYECGSAVVLSVLVVCVEYYLYGSLAELARRLVCAVSRLILVGVMGKTVVPYEVEDAVIRL